MDTRGIGEKSKFQQAKEIMEVLKQKVMFQMRQLPCDVSVQWDGFGESWEQGDSIVQG